MENDTTKWIQEARAKGMPDNEIKNQLLSSGWQEEQANRALSKINKVNNTEQDLIQNFEEAQKSRTKYIQITLTVGYAAAFINEYVWDNIVPMIISIIAIAAYIAVASAFFGKKHVSFINYLLKQSEKYGLPVNFQYMAISLALPALLLSFYIFGSKPDATIGIAFYALSIFMPRFYDFYMKRVISILAKKMQSEANTIHDK